MECIFNLLNRNSMAVCFKCPFLATKIHLILALPPIVSVVIVLPSSHILIMVVTNTCKCTALLSVRLVCLSHIEMYPQKSS